MEKTPRQHVSQRYFVTFNNSLMPEKKYKFYSSDNFFGKISDQASVRGGLDGTLGNRYNAINHYQKTEKN